MKDETIQKACDVDSRYFGEVSVRRSLAAITSQVESMVELPTEANVREQTGDLMFAVVSLARNQGWDLDTLLAEATTKIERRRRERHYYEAHVTVEPVFEERLEQFKATCRQHKFHVATLLMQKRKEDTEERSKNDSFCTGRGVSYSELQTRMFALMTALKAEGFKVWRYKIESTLLDSRYNDEKFPLDRESLPEKERQPRAPADGSFEGRLK